MRRNSIALLALLTLILASCGPVEIAGLWRTTEVTVDGKADDWQGALYTIPDEPVLAGVRNDDRYVYLCLQIDDPRPVGSILRRGLVVWFDPAGGQRKVLGVKFPLGMRLDDFEGPDEGARDRGDQDRLPRIDRDQVEILGPGRDELIRLKKDELKGIEVALENQGGRFIYELKIPLARGADAPYAAASAPGKILGIGFEQPELELPAFGPGRGGGGMGRGMGGRGGMGGPGEMGGMGRGRDAKASLSLWLKVTLATKPK